MKKLDKLIIKSFIGPFVATFFITVFVLIMQFFWLWIDDFVGKGVDITTIFKFILYLSATLIPLALPLSVLLSSLMTFGNLGETFELVAIKSSGISLLRFMRPLFFVAVIISIGAFLFSNYVIPVAYLKQRTLLADVVLAKPAFAIKEGVFYDKIDGFAIKIGKKENDSIIHDVIVFEQNNVLQDRFIVAKSGIMKPSADRHFLDFYLKNGWRYEERGYPSDSLNTDYVRLGFKEYKKQFDISVFDFKTTADSNNHDNRDVLNMRQLDKVIDSMSKFTIADRERFNRGIWNSLGLLVYKDSITNVKIPDSIFNYRKNTAEYLGIKKFDRKIAVPTADSIQFALKGWEETRKKDSVEARKKFIKDSIAIEERIKDSIENRKAYLADSLMNDSIQKTIQAKQGGTTPSATEQKAPPIQVKKPEPKKQEKKIEKAIVKKVDIIPGKNDKSFEAILPDSARSDIYQRALSVINSMKSNIEMSSSSIYEQEKDIRRYKIEWHRKISLAIACIVLFMIGAPLGSIIRKGGLGTPLIFAIVFFMIFYFVSTRGEKLAKEDEMSPFNGMWLATYVLVPIGLFLTYKAMHDSNLFSKEFYSRLKRAIRKKLGIKPKTENK